MHLRVLPFIYFESFLLISFDLVPIGKDSEKSFPISYLNATQEFTNFYLFLLDQLFSRRSFPFSHIEPVRYFVSSLLLFPCFII